MFWKFIAGALSENENEPSEMRVKAFYIAVLLATVIAFGFVYTVIFYKDLVIPYLSVITALVTASMTFKWLQKKEEMK